MRILLTKQRIAWVDIAKAITMFLVVFGHTLRDGFAQDIVFSFHVAAFFLLSGMTCKADNLKERIKNDFLRILIPYYCFSVLSILIFSLLGNFVADKFDIYVDTSVWHNLADTLYACPTNNRLKFNTPLWFLPCLFITKLLYYCLNKLCKEKQVYILLSSLFLAGLGFVYTRLIQVGLPFNLSVSVKMLPFFVLGRSFFLWVPATKGCFFQGYSAILLGSAMLIITGLIAVASPKIDYASDTIPNIVTFLITTLVGSFGICLLAMGLNRCKWLEYVGQSTLCILVVHKFPILFFQTIGPQKALLAQYDSPVGIASAAIISVISIILCLVAELMIRRCVPFLLGNFSRCHLSVRS